LIFSPLKALMRDQVRKLQELGIAAFAISSDSTPAENDYALRCWADGECDILYAAPERLANDTFKQAMRQRSPDMIAIDEVHTLSSWSDNFRHAYTLIGDAIERYQPRTVLAVTATFNKPIEKDVRRVLGLPRAKKIVSYTPRENLKLSSSWMESKQDVLDKVREHHVKTLIYCGSQKNTEEYAQYLGKQLKEEVGIYHADVNGAVKKSCQDRFARKNDLRIICATNAFGMGVDIPDIGAVIHVIYPADPEALDQECVHPDSYITTENGLKVASEVVVGDKMLDTDFATGYSSGAMITECLENTTVELVEIRTKLGSSMRVTPSHPVFVREGAELREVPAGELAAGMQVLAKRDLPPAVRSAPKILDWLVDCPEPIFVQTSLELYEKVRSSLSLAALQGFFRLARPYDFWAYKDSKCGRLSYWLEACAAAGVSEDEFLSHVVKYKTRSGKRHSLPELVTTDLAWLAGIMATDGYIHRSEPGNGYGSWKLKLGNTNSRIADKFERIITGLGLCCHRYVRAPKETGLSKTPLIIVECSSPILVHILGKMGIPAGKKTYKVSIPGWLRSADRGVIGAYLAGALDGDGSLNKDRYSFRFHSAGWGYLSGVAMLLRSEGVVASCYAEDYTCKAHVMRAASANGYSFLVSSTVAYENVRDWVSPFSCKEWLPFRQPNKGQDMTKQRQERRSVFSLQNEDWLVDEILEVIRFDYAGAVLNWRVEPGNQLTVEGILTHNCGRGGRDGNNCFCHAFESQWASNFQLRILEGGNPPKNLFERVFKAMRAKADASDTFHMDGQELAVLSNVSDNYHMAILQTLQGARVIETVKGHAKVYRMKIIEEPAWEDTDKKAEKIHYARMVQFIRKEFSMSNGFYDFDLDVLAQMMGLAPATTGTHLRNWHKEERIQYEPPPRATPKRIIGDLSLVDFDRLALKRQDAFKKLDYVKGYFGTPDHAKAGYLRDYYLATSGD